MRDVVSEKFTELFGPEFGHGKALDLAAVEEVLRRLDWPNANLGPVIHIAGTNGKGSTLAFMRSIAEAAGISVSAFTKPQLFLLNERFYVRGEIANDQMLISGAEEVAAISTDISQFDAQVCVALNLFDLHPSRLVLLETGMGGRDDSTNVVPWPTATVITPIGLDHQDVLGETEQEIAAHKAGIFKRLSPAVIARQTPGVMSVLEAKANEISAPLFRQGIEWDAFAQNGRLIVQTERRVLDLPLPALVGQHQIENAGLACATFLAPGPFNFDDNAFAQGISSARWLGRLTPLTHGPFSAPIRASGGEVWVDGGHNAHAGIALSYAMQDMKARRGGKNIAMVGLRKRKDATLFIAALARFADHIIAVPLADDHVSTNELAALGDKLGIDSTTAPSLSIAMQNAAQLPAPRVLICGSFVLAAEALAAEAS